MIGSLRSPSCFEHVGRNRSSNHSASHACSFHPTWCGCRTIACLFRVEPEKVQRRKTSMRSYVRCLNELAAAVDPLLISSRRGDRPGTRFSAGRARGRSLPGSPLCNLDTRSMVQTGVLEEGSTRGKPSPRVANGSYPGAGRWRPLRPMGLPLAVERHQAGSPGRKLLDRRELPPPATNRRRFPVQTIYATFRLPCWQNASKSRLTRSACVAVRPCGRFG